MDFEAFKTELHRIADQARGLAAVGAALRLRQGALKADPDVEARLAETIAALLPGGLDQLDPDQTAAALNIVAFALQEARDLFEEPDRRPAWEVRDPAMLQAQGQASRGIAHSLMALAAERPALSAALDGRMLDVGVGVAALALEAAAQRPSLKVVGIDIWEPALALARANVAASPNADRVELRRQDVTRLDEVAAYTLAWLPTPFMSHAATEAALDRLTTALKPGGYLVAGLYAPPPDPLGAALSILRLTRSGGALWRTCEIEAEFLALGLGAVETRPGPPSVALVLGQRPAP